jgi:DNA-binding NtrC family response regulator
MEMQRASGARQDLTWYGEFFYWLSPGKSNGRFSVSLLEEIDDDLVASIREMGLRILVVDDQQAFRKAMGFTLQKTFDADVLALSSGTAAIEVVSKGRSFDRVFLDIRMSPLDGIETYNELQRIGVACPVTMMSAHVSREDAATATKLGLEVIPKPIKLGDLVRVLLESSGRSDG